MKYHKLLHRRELALKESGYSHLIKCSICSRYSEPEDITIYSRKDGSETYYHSVCHAAKQRALRAGKKPNIKADPPELPYKHTTITDDEFAEFC